MGPRVLPHGLPPGAARAAKRLGEALDQGGWRLSRSPAGALEASRGRQKIAVELRYAREPRRELLRALLADAILSGRARAGANGTCLAVVAAPAISQAMAASLVGYAGEVAPGQPFGYVDERGFARVHGHGFEKVELEAEGKRGSGREPPRPRDLFSDMNQWMLKVLLGSRLDRKLITVPRHAGGAASGLAKVAGASIPSSWRLLSSLRAAGHLDGAGKLVRAPELLAAWRSAALRPQREFGATWVLPGRTPLERLGRELARSASNSEPIACLGLFAACEALGLGHVRGAPVHLYVRRADPELLEGLGLVQAEGHGAADVIVRVARWPESVFRAAARIGGVPVADVIQCWLDVSSHPSRGAEQAELIWKRVLGPALGDEGSQP